MIDIILSHWATYLFLVWIAVIVLVNLWPRKKLAGGVDASRFSEREK